MFVSTFELLLNTTQLPREIEGVMPAQLDVFDPISRNLIQGYFLTISNLEDRSIILDLHFKVVTNPIFEDMFDNITSKSFFDSQGNNVEVAISPVDEKTRSIVLKIPAHDTGLLVVQPNPFLLLEGLNTSEIEIRGYVEAKVLLAHEDCHRSTKILLTPEQRGTFYQLDIPENDDGTVDRDAPLTLSKNQQLDQIAYSLPTAKGGSLFKFSKKKKYSDNRKYHELDRRHYKHINQ